MPKLTVELTYEEANTIFLLVDGARDAGSCEGGLSDLEFEATEKLEDALRKFMKKHKEARDAE